jgi:hypothetical protein
MEWKRLLASGFLPLAAGKGITAVGNPRRCWCCGFRVGLTNNIECLLNLTRLPPLLVLCAWLLRWIHQQHVCMLNVYTTPAVVGVVCLAFALGSPTTLYAC